MKSSEEQLKNRGYITIEEVNNYAYLTNNELLELLKSKEAYKRTIAVNLLSNRYLLDNEMVKLFCDMLLHEKKLYTKLELCNALRKASADSVDIMVNYLGIIGNNHYKELPDKEFNKKSYPLPRDIIARTISHMSADVLPQLIKILKSNNIIAIREVIDAIGFICFYNPNSFSENVVYDLIICFNQYFEEDIIRWKIVRAFESYNCKSVMDLLTDIKKNDTKEIIRKEAERSLKIIQSR